MDTEVKKFGKSHQGHLVSQAQTITTQITALTRPRDPLDIPTTPQNIF